MGILATNFEFLFFYQLNIINLALTDWLVSQYIIVFWMFDWRGSNTKAHSIFYCKGHFYWPAALKMWTSIDPRSRIDGEDNCIFKFCKFSSMVIEKIFVSTRHTSLKNAQFAIKWNVYSHLDCSLLIQTYLGPWISLTSTIPRYHQLVNLLTEFSRIFIES